MSTPSILARLALGCVFVAAFAGCVRPPHAPAPNAELAPGQYRATVELPGGFLPFGFKVADEGGRRVVYLQNGAESARSEDLEIHGGRFVLRFAGYENRIEAARDAEGFSGVAVMLRRGGREIRLPFRAVAGETYRFAPVPMPDPPNVAGRWAMTMTPKDGVPAPAIAELRQEGAHVVGTVLDPTGDHRFLEGDVVGEELELSRFDGGAAFLYRAQIQPDGTLKGHQWVGNWYQTDIAAHRDDDATLSDPAVAAAEAARDAPFAFSFPDLDGRTVSLSDARFKDKVVIVTLGGSWCPNCHDEAAFLAPLYRDLHPRGLEIIYLQFEYFGDFPLAVAANRRFVAEFGIDWPVLIAGISDKDEASRKLPRLGKVFAFPTTLVVDRKGALRNVHSGFAGPATGKHYDEYRQEFTGLVETLLAEHD